MDVEPTLDALMRLDAKWVLGLLLALGVAAIAVVADRIAVLLLSRDDLKSLQRNLRRQLDCGKLEEARASLAESRSFEARIVVAGLFAEGPRCAQERMVGERQLVRLEMERNLMYLGILGRSAPLIGVYGSLTGIIGALRQLDAGVSQGSAELGREVGEALLVLAAGLLVALLAATFFDFFQHVVRRRIVRADAIGRDVLAYFNTREEDGSAALPTRKTN